MKNRTVKIGEIFDHCKCVGDVCRALHEAVKIASSQDQVDYLDASHIARIKELRKNG